MAKKWPFIYLFAASFAVTTLVAVILFIVLGLRITDSFFSYYVDKLHGETQHMLVMQATGHYKMAGSWQGYDGSESAAVAKLSGDYFSITSSRGETVYTSEKGVEHCCDNPSHVYTVMTYPLVVDGKEVGQLSAGYFTNHISSPEAKAFRSSSVFLVVLSILCISISAALVSLLFFHRLSRPMGDIARTAKDISQGHLQSRVSIHSNVVEMHDISDSINALGASLRSQEEFRRQLVVDLSHELRTPLQILLNQIESILDGFHKADIPRLEAMHAEITRTGELLNELEDRLIYENDTFELNILPTDISEVTRKVALGHEGAFAQKGLTFTTAIAAGIVVPADSVRFAQILINVLSNALKYTDNGSVSLVLQRTEAGAELSVMDSGQGMASEIMENINKRSVQAFKAVNSKGVGLYIAKLIIDKHRWKLDLSSAGNAGTLVRIHIGK